MNSASNATSQIAILGALFTLFAALLATLVNYYRERSESQKWKRTLELEERRIKHEEIKWALELNNQREMEIHRVRLKTYPEIFTALSSLSHHNLHKLTDDRLLELADMLNSWGYGESGLCMLPDTRDAVFRLRNTLTQAAQGKIQVRELVSRNSTRTELIELMRRDLNHSWSPWREFKSLLEMNEKSLLPLIGHKDEQKMIKKQL